MCNIYRTPPVGPERSKVIRNSSEDVCEFQAGLCRARFDGPSHGLEPDQDRFGCRRLCPARYCRRSPMRASGWLSSKEVERALEFFGDEYVGSEN